MNDNLLELFNEIPKIKQILPHQIAILDYIINHINKTNDGILLYSKPGTGKTLIGIITALILSNERKVLLLMPSENILTLWQNTIGLALTLIDNNYDLNNIELTSMHTFIFNVTNNNIILETTIQKYKNHIVIIDEAHNILNNSQFEVLIQLKKINQNIFILLTGSPINNTVETLPNLLKLLVDEIYVDKDLISTNNKVFEIKFKEEKLNTIKKLCLNNVSYYETPKSLLPRVEFEGELCGLTFNCIICLMTKEHYKIFLDAKQQTKNEIFEKVLMNVSLFGVEDVFITDDINRLQIREYRKGLSYNGSYFVGNELEKLNYAPKIKEMLQHFNYFGKHFIYFANASYGSLIIKSVMNFNGYIEYSFNKTFQWTNKTICYKCGKKQTCDACIPATYIILTGQNINLINDYLDIFNTSANNEGAVIKFIFGSNVLSEAYTLKETPYTHYLTIPDNYTQIEQINGRTIRKFAFKNNNILVKIFMYLAVEPDYFSSKASKYQTYSQFLENIDNIISYDFKKLLYIDLKNYETNKLLNVLKESSVHYNDKINDKINNIVILNRLKEIFYKQSRIPIKDLINLYDKKIYNLSKNEFYEYVVNIINNHPSVINKYFNLCLLYNINKEIITIPMYCDYGVIYNSYYMKKEINKLDINKKKANIYIIIDRETLISYENSIINIKSLTAETLIEICKKIDIELIKNKKYYKQDLIKLIIDKLLKLDKENPNIIYVIKN
jgi:hypothetical protein